MNCFLKFMHLKPDGHGTISSLYLCIFCTLTGNFSLNVIRFKQIRNNTLLIIFQYSFETILFELIFPLHVHKTITKCLAITYERQISISKLHFQLGKPLRQTQFHCSMGDTIFSRENNLYTYCYYLSLYSYMLWKYISSHFICYYEEEKFQYFS